ncbi:MAG: ketol-acid reductoisomerase [Phycisphaerales bacterium]|nr:MAG: ketol-acid reductoisomerase [Phycisphaerales bacterium]
MKIIQGSDAVSQEPLAGKTVAVVGFGNQGRAHALNLRESGVQVVVATRPGSAGAQRAADAGFPPIAAEEAATRADLAILALPDEVQPVVYAGQIAPHLRPGVTVGFLTGFAVHHGLIEPAAGIGVVMVAPKGPGHALRRRYEQGQGIPCLFAVHQESPAGDAEALGLAWAGAIGCARAGIIFTTFAHETETDLFGEQTVLCGGMSWLILAAFETLVDAGYPPELAYMECCQEVKQIGDLIYERGIAGMMDAISNTAEFGAHEVGPELVDDETREKMRQILQRIRSGEFARRMQEDHEAGFPKFNTKRRKLAAHPNEPAGATVRSLLPWLAESPQ